MTKEEADELYRSKLAELEAWALLGLTDVPCPYGHLPHLKYCHCEGTNFYTVSQYLDDLMCDLECLSK